MNDKDITNWVDPDIVVLSGADATFDLKLESEFKHFFEVGWLDSQFDDLREKWDKHLNDPSPHARVLGKTALWAVVQHRKIQRRVEDC